MMAPRRCADPLLSPPATLLSRLRSAASYLQMSQFSSRKEGDGGGMQNGRSTSAPRPGFVDPSSWRYFDSRAVGIPAGAIPRNAWAVLQMLKRKGFEAYLVGGCVRNLLLKRVPKDFDVITTASLKQVSSFSTNDNNLKGSDDLDCSEELNGYDEGDILRWKNSMKRDFTINGLFFNPFNYRIYDYVNGVRDIRKDKVCTMIPAHVSFKEDPVFQRNFYGNTGTGWRASVLPRPAPAGRTRSAPAPPLTRHPTGPSSSSDMCCSLAGLLGGCWNRRQALKEVQALAALVANVTSVLSFFNLSYTSVQVFDIYNMPYLFS